MQQQAKHSDKLKVTETVVPNKHAVSFIFPAGGSVPFHFVCKRLVVLNHLALLRWRGGGPGSVKEEVTQAARHSSWDENHSAARMSEATAA